MAKIVTLTEAASIAIHSMIIVAKSDKNLNVDFIAEKIDSSKHHVAKVMQRLVKDGFIMSMRGPLGGFRLKKNANEITLLDIYESIEGHVEISKCPFDKKVCPFDKCFMDNITNALTTDFKNYLQSQTLDLYL